MSSSPPRNNLTAPVRTPNRRGVSAEPPSTIRRGPVHTPLDRSVTRDLLRSVRRTPASAIRNNNAPTPHAKAARRALDQRRTAMFTPGKNRRKSQYAQRQTPMSFLKELGRALAPKSKPVESSSSSSPELPPSRSRRSSARQSARSSAFALQEEDEDEFVARESRGPNDEVSSDDQPLKRPRLSLPIDRDDDDDEEDLRPPRLSGVSEFDYTAYSIEEPRRFDPSAQARASIGSFRPSDVFERQRSPSDDMEDPSDFFPGGWEEIQQPMADDPTLDRLDNDLTLQSVTGRESGLPLEVPSEVGDQTTFVLSPPNLDAAATSPLRDQSPTAADAPDVAESRDAPPAGDFDELDAPAFDSDDSGPPPFNDMPEYDDRSDSDGVPQFDEMPAYDDHSDIEELPLQQEVVDEDTTVTKPYERKDREINRPQEARAKQILQLRKKQKKISQHGIEYPALPPAFVKKVAQTAIQSSGLSNTRLSADTLLALTQASEWYFEQLGDDLGAYASHAKRKTIEESDVATLMRRQRQVSSSATMFSLAQKHLPRELLQDLRMPLPQSMKQKRGAKRSRPGDDDAGEEAENP